MENNKYIFEPDVNYFIDKNRLNYNTKQFLEKNKFNRVELIPENKTLELFWESSSEKYIHREIHEDLIKNLLLKTRFANNIKLSGLKIKKDKILENEILKFSKTIVNDCIDQFPSTLPFISISEFKIDKDKFIVEVRSDKAVNYLQKLKLNQFINKLIYEHFSVNFIVEFVVGDFEKEEKQMKKKIDLYFKKKEEQKKIELKKRQHIIVGKDILKLEPTLTINEILSETKNVVINGFIIKHRVIDISQSKYNYGFNYKHIFILTDYLDSINCSFRSNRNFKFEDYQTVKVRGNIKKNKFEGLQINVYDMNFIDGSFFEVKKDTVAEKRVELHLHTAMSKQDALIKIEKLIPQLKKWGHTKCAVTDHGNAHIFPEFYDECKKNQIKPILGIEGYLVDDISNIIVNEEKISDKNDNVFITFFNVQDNYYVNAEKYNLNNELIGKFYYNNFDEILLEKLGLDLVLENNEKIENWQDEFYEFCQESNIFNYDVLKTAEKTGLENLGLIDIRQVFKLVLNNNKLNWYDYNQQLTEYLNSKKIEIDFNFLIEPSKMKTVFDFIFNELKTRKNLELITDLKKIELNNIENRKGKAKHIIILVQNKIGLRNLYELISLSNLENFYYVPKIFKSKLKQKSEGLIIGSACEAGEVYQTFLLNSDIYTQIEIMDFYDYIELQPVTNNYFLINKDEFSINDFNDLRDINKNIFKLSDVLGKKTLATSDAHYLFSYEKVYQDIIKYDIGMKDSFTNKVTDLSFKTTNEMLDEFKYLEDVRTGAAEEVVIKNTNYIADIIEDVQPIPDGFYPPQIEGAEDKLKKIVYQKIEKLYGKTVPEVIQKRVDKELKSIITNQFSNLYYIAHIIVNHARENNIIVGSRGSVGSSVVAFFADITDVNALPPHYRCEKCCYSEFDVPKEFLVGPDLPDKKCPECNEELIKDGYNIFFEVFLGFEGDKVPDIDLNFPGFYLSTIHKYVEKLFGKENVFRAGTISTIAEGNARLITRKFVEENNLNKRFSEIERLALGCQGVKKTTGQHPGGMVVVPKDKSIYDFCPIQYPANKATSETITTHFDYHKMESQLVKLDLLGQDDPTQLILLNKYTGVDLDKIPWNDEKTLKLFNSTESIDLDAEKLGFPIACFAIPEVGTPFVRQMLVDTKPKNIGELIRISGLSHGTNVWKGNAQDLIRKKVASLDKVISTRDDVMLYLMQCGMEPKVAFNIMERVRKGKGLTDDNIKIMKEHKVPQWYIDSCLKISYLFPKAHAVAYVMMAYKIAYFKANYPVAFYTSFISIKSELLELSHLLMSVEELNTLLKERAKLKKKREITKKDESQIPLIEVIKEMKLRKIEVLPVDITKSLVSEAVIVDDKILLPLNTVDSLGAKAADKIVEERQKKPFLTIKEFKERTKANKNVIQALKDFKCFGDLPEDEFISLF